MGGPRGWGALRLRLNRPLPRLDIPGSLTRGGTRVRRQSGKKEMPVRFACLRPVRMLVLAATAAFAVAWASPLAAQQPAPPVPAAAIEAFKADLDETEAVLRRESLSDNTLAEIRGRLAELRDRLRAQADALEPQLADLDARL